MNEKNVTKISLSTFFLILAVIVIIVMGIFMYKTYNEKNVATEKVSDLNGQVSNLKSTVDQLQGKINSISDTINNDNIKENSISTNNVTENDFTSDNILFTEKQVKHAFKKYLDLIAAREASPSSVLKELKLINEEATKAAKKEGYLKTDVKFSKFKETILQYITLNCLQKDFSTFIEEDGYLCYFNGGATGIGYEVTKITKVNDKKYKADAIWSQEEARENVNFEFGIENNNGKCVIDYCNKN